MFVVAPLEAADEEGDDWEGTIRKLTRVVESQAKQIKIKIGSQCTKL